MFGVNLVTFDTSGPEVETAQRSKRVQEVSEDPVDVPLTTRRDMGVFCASKSASNPIMEDGQLAFLVEALGGYCVLVCDGHGGAYAVEMFKFLFPKLLLRRAEFLASPRYTEML